MKRMLRMPTPMYRYEGPNKQGNGVAIVEMPPTKRCIFINEAPLQLTFPWVVFGVEYRVDEKTLKWKFYRLSVGFRNVELKSLKEDIGEPLLPNVFQHYVCSSKQIETSEFESLASLL